MVVAWSVTTPLGTAADEPEHYTKTLAAGRGDLRGHPPQGDPIDAVAATLERESGAGSRADRLRAVRWVAAGARSFALPARLVPTAIGCFDNLFRRAGHLAVPARCKVEPPSAPGERRFESYEAVNPPETPRPRRVSAHPAGRRPQPGQGLPPGPGRHGRRCASSSWAGAPPRVGPRGGPALAGGGDGRDHPPAGVWSFSAPTPAGSRSRAPMCWTAALPAAAARTPPATGVGVGRGRRGRRGARHGPVERAAVRRPHPGVPRPALRPAGAVGRRQARRPARPPRRGEPVRPGSGGGGHLAAVHPAVPARAPGILDHVGPALRRHAADAAGVRRPLRRGLPRPGGRRGRVGPAPPDGARRLQPPIVATPRQRLRLALVPPPPLAAFHRRLRRRVPDQRVPGVLRPLRPSGARRAAAVAPAPCLVRTARADGRRRAPEAHGQACPAAQRRSRCWRAGGSSPGASPSARTARSGSSATRRGSRPGDGCRGRLRCWPGAWPTRRWRCCRGGGGRAGRPGRPPVPARTAPPAADEPRHDGEDEQEAERAAAACAPAEERLQEVGDAQRPEHVAEEVADARPGTDARCGGSTARVRTGRARGSGSPTRHGTRGRCGRGRRARRWGRCTVAAAATARSGAAPAGPCPPGRGRSSRDTRARAMMVGRNTLTDRAAPPGARGSPRRLAANPQRSPRTVRGRRARGACALAHGRRCWRAARG